MNESTIPIRDAKARLSELATRAAKGERLVISRHGEPVARLVPVHKPRKRVSLSRLQALTRGAPRQPVGAGRALRRLREQARY